MADVSAATIRVASGAGEPRFATSKQSSAARNTVGKLTSKASLGKFVVASWESHFPRQAQIIDVNVGHAHPRERSLLNSSHPIKSSQANAWELLIGCGGDGELCS